MQDKLSKVLFHKKYFYYYSYLPLQYQLFCGEEECYNKSNPWCLNNLVPVYCIEMDRREVLLTCLLKHCKKMLD